MRISASPSSTTSTVSLPVQCYAMDQSGKHRVIVAAASSLKSYDAVRRPQLRFVLVRHEELAVRPKPHLRKIKRHIPSLLPLQPTPCTTPEPFSKGQIPRTEALNVFTVKTTSHVVMTLYYRMSTFMKSGNMPSPLLSSP